MNSANLKGDKISQLETEVELHRTIVSAAERLASDRATNKSVRKKRRKDLQTATQRLKSLEKKLQRLRVSGSNKDAVSLDSGCSSSVGEMMTNSGSGFSLNSLSMSFSNNYNKLEKSIFGTFFYLAFLVRFSIFELWERIVKERPELINNGRILVGVQTTDSHKLAIKQYRIKGGVQKMAV